MVYSIEILRKNPELLAQCGGKGKNLYHLHTLGLPVPAFAVLPFEALNKLLPVDIQLFYQRITRSRNLPLEAQIEVCTEIRQEIGKLQLQPEIVIKLKDEICRSLSPEKLWAVRSSVRFEDQAHSSFAGMFHTELNLSIDNLETGIKNCLAALFDYPVIEYSHRKGIDPSGNEIALVIQEMVDATISGVIFTMNASGNLNDMLISCAYGSGQGVVENTSDTNEYYINRQNAVISIRDESMNILNQKQLEELSKHALEIEKHFGKAQDFEFSFEGEKLYWLQARPITTIDVHKLKIIDNTNIVESYPGITMPLSFSFARRGYEQVFRAAAKMFRLTEQQTAGIDEELSNMIIHVKGRVYYNLHHWYKIVQLVIESDNSLKAWETLIGIKSGKSTRTMLTFFRLLKVIGVTLMLFVRYNRIVADFYSAFERDYKTFRDFLKDIRTTKPDVIQAFVQYNSMSPRLYKNWAATQMNDFFTFRYYGALTRMVEKMQINNAGTVVNDLLCGQSGVESEELIIELLNIKEIIINEPAYLKLFDQNDEVILHQAPESLRVHLDYFIDRFGDRTLEELKLETPNFRLNPAGFIALLRSFLGNQSTPESVAKRQQEIGRSAMQKVQKQLKGKYFRQLLFYFLLSKTRISIRNRENMRLRRARAYGLAKEFFDYIAEQLTNQGILAEKKDIFYLKIEEVEEICIHHQHNKNWKSLVEERKNTFADYATLTLPDRMVFNGDAIPYLHLHTMQSSSDQALTGTGISAGILEAPCIILTKPDYKAEVEGKILVTRMTDPAWVFLMSRAAGLISEKGSPLSHTAIVGRELGIHVIIGVTGATEKLKTGMVVRMDCAAGKVEVVI